MRFNIEKFYPDLIESMRLKIVSQYGSIKHFCAEKGFSEFSLSKVFNGHRNISVRLYLEINASLLGLSPDDNMNIDQNLTLIDYMKINHDMVVNFILQWFSQAGKILVSGI